jgi:hypothetical protein
MRRHQIVFLNGPRRSGKDTAAKFIAQEFALEARTAKFAMPLKLAAAAMFNLNQGRVRQLEAPGSKLKSQRLPELFDMTWPEVLIWLSEECMKPKFGKDVFGLLMLSYLAQPTLTSITVISDCGFADELTPIIQLFGAENCHLFRIYRDGHTFAGDSRGYVFENDVPVGLHIEDIHNQHDIGMFRVQILRRVDKILGRQMEYHV